MRVNGVLEISLFDNDCLSNRYILNDPDIMFPVFIKKKKTPTFIASKDYH